MFWKSGETYTAASYWALRQMTEIFLSHIHEDADVACALSSYLKGKIAKLPWANSPDIFISSDQYAIRVGDDWLAKIKASLQSAKIIVALFSPAALGRPWVHFESGGAWFQEGKTLMPVCIGGLDPAALPKPYSNIQWVNLHEPSSPNDLLQSVYRALDRQGMSPFLAPDEFDSRLQEALEKIA
jgi:TIR domain